MARFRIIKRPCLLDPCKPRYDVQERVLWWWEDYEHGEIFYTMEEAEKYVERLQRGDCCTRLVLPQVVKEYD